MKTNVLFLISCCIPYAFLALYGDAAYGTMAFYVIMIAAFSIIGRASIRARNIILLYIGNIVSCGVSLTAAWLFGLNDMNWYFKPFTAVSLIITVSALTVLIHSIFVIISVRRQKSKGRDAS